MHRHCSLCVAAGVNAFKIILNLQEELIMLGMVPREWLSGLPEVGGEGASASNKKRKASPAEDEDYLQMFNSQEAPTRIT